MAATRLMPTEEGQDLIDLTREICEKELRPKVDEAERAAATGESFPTEVFRTLGQAGLLSLPHPEEFGGFSQPYEVYLQVVEEIASAWMSVAVGVSVHSLTAFPVTTFGTQAQKESLLPGMLSGDQLGAYCLSEQQAGSDVGSMTTRAVPRRPRHGDGEPSAYRLRGRKAWISHAGHADYYTTFARTSDDGGRGLSCFVVPGRRPGAVVRHPRAEDGPALRHRARGAVRRRPRRRLPPDRRTRARAWPSHCRHWMPAASGSPLPQRVWRSRRSTSRCPTRRSASSSAGPSPRTRAWRSSSPTWRRR